MSSTVLQNLFVKYESSLSTISISPGWIFHTEKNEIFVPATKINATENLEKLCGEVLLGAGSDRNLVVFDSQSPVNIISNRLLAIATKVINEYSDKYQKITDIFICEYAVTEPDFIKKDLLRFVDIDTWKYLESYYLNKLDCVFPTGKKNLMVFVDNSNQKNFIMPVHKKNYYGLLCTNNNVLLGSY